MIDIKEIRVGIILFNQITNKEFKVDKQNIGAVINDHIKHPYAGVPISEDKLKEYGFKSEAFKTRSANYRDYTLSNKRGRVLYYLADGTFDFNVEFNRIIKDVKYIHQVQNMMLHINLYKSKN